MHTIWTRFFIGLAVATSLSGCGANPAISRISPDQVMDLSGNWNDTDSRVVADALIQQSFESPYGANWAMRFAQANGGKAPSVVVGTVRNKSMEHIAVGTFVSDLQRAYVNSGIVEVIVGGANRDELRAERQDQQDNAAANTRAALSSETGANYMLQGEIQTIEDREGGRSVMFYQVDLNLVDLQTNAMTWVGQHKIKKYIERSRLRP